MKNKTHYFCHSYNGTKAKNNLQGDFQKYLNNLNGSLVEKSALPKLKKQILEKAEEFNKIHSRCQPLELYFWETYKNNWQIRGLECQKFQIIPAELKEL